MVLRWSLTYMYSYLCPIFKSPNALCQKLKNKKKLGNIYYTIQLQTWRKQSFKQEATRCGSLSDRSTRSTPLSNSWQRCSSLVLVVEMRQRPCVSKPRSSISLIHFVTMIGMLLLDISRCFKKSTPNVVSLRSRR